MSKDRQLIMDLALRPALGREDFMVTQSNAAALALIDRWPGWQGDGAVIVGPPGSGKTHLVEVFRSQVQVTPRPAPHLTIEDGPILAEGRAIVIEDVEAGKFEERALFHLLNLARQTGKLVLLTAVSPPSQWTIGLPDLRTRLQALPVVPLLLPDDELLRAVLLKQFHDRQLAVSQPVIAYLISHLPRSLEVVRLVASEIDRRSLVQRVEITRPFVAEVLRDISAPSFTPFADEGS
jgi:chromosomal replication initiation ATPase DnaA